MRQILKAALGAALLAGGLGTAAAQPTAPYPDRPVQVIVSWQAGGVVDTIGRALAQAMSEASEGRFVVVNRAGTGTFSLLGLLGAGPLYLTFERVPAEPPG